MGLEPTGPPGPVHFEQQFAVASAPFVHLLRGRITQRELDIAGGLNDPRGLAVDVSQARKTVQIRPPLEHHHSVARATEKRREHKTGRPVSDHRDIEICRHHNSLLPGAFCPMR